MTAPFSKLSPAHQAFVSRYMDGRCDALAIALSVYFDYSIVAMRPVHVRADGTKRVDPDFLHVYVVDAAGMAWDARGNRTQESVREDFEPFLQVLRRVDDVAMDVDLSTYDDAREFVENSGCDPSGAAQALEDAIEHLGLSAEMASSARLMLQSESGFEPDELSNLARLGF